MPNVKRFTMVSKRSTKGDSGLDSSRTGSVSSQSNKKNSGSKRSTPITSLTGSIVKAAPTSIEVSKAPEEEEYFQEEEQKVVGPEKKKTKKMMDYGATTSTAITTTSITASNSTAASASMTENSTPEKVSKRALDVGDETIVPLNDERLALMQNTDKTSLEDDFVDNVNHVAVQGADVDGGDEMDGKASFEKAKTFESLRRMQAPVQKTQTSFWEDARSFAEGTVPQSIAIALVIGGVCGVAAFLYYTVLFGVLEYLWHTLPNAIIVGHWYTWLYFLWIPIVGFAMAVFVGLSVVYMGEPGDLAYTVKCVHEKGYISMSHVLPMVAASQFSILGGGSLGPEAPLVAICAALGGHISRKIFHIRSRNIVRKHTLMGMAGALAAFFGCPLGGSLFALEVNSRNGVEYFEHTVEAIFCGEVCLVVFRSLSGLPIAPIWTITPDKLDSSTPVMVVTGAAIGLLGAGVAALFANFHFRVMAVFSSLGYLDNKNAVQRALLGSVVIVFCGILVPHTLFWGEFEFQTISTMSDATTLDHVWPTSGLIGFEMHSAFHAFIVGITKLIAISFTVSGGYRGGFIFPFFAAGAALGRAITFMIPSIPDSLACLGMAAGINVAITRTSLATPLILVYLAGEQNALSGVLAASIVSLFATSYMPFIKSQIVRSDIDSSLFSNEYEPQLEDSVRNFRKIYKNRKANNIDDDDDDDDDDEEKKMEEDGTIIAELV